MIRELREIPKSCLFKKLLRKTANPHVVSRGNGYKCGRNALAGDSGSRRAVIAAHENARAAVVELHDA
jgi:hypothetical protein